MTRSLEQLVKELESKLPEYERRRYSTDFANDIFEAMDDLRQLGHKLLEGDTRVNYPGRVRQERELWKQLRELLQKRPVEDQQQLAPVFDTVERILQIAEAVRPPKDGHLGTLRVIRELFAFLQMSYHFVIVKEEPIGIRFSSGEVYLELGWAKKYNSSCVFGPEPLPQKSFFIDDLLFLHGDQRYRTLPEDLALNTEQDVERWFAFLADVFKQYGQDVLANRPGIFEELAKAQTQRDQEYTREMDRRHGQR